MTMAAVGGRAVLTAPRLGRVRNVDAALARHGDRVNLYIESMRWGDPLADAFAADCAHLAHGEGMALLDLALAEGSDAPGLADAPASLHALLAHVEAVPFWHDADQIDLGAAAYSRHAREAGIALGTSSLVSGYSNAASVAPLVVTGRFRHQADIRAVETSTWVFATARPGGLRRDGLGFARTVRVRMIHAFVRRHILEHVEWDQDDLGLPINQADLAYTVVEFSYLPIRAIRRLGVHFSAEELAGMYAMWRYMGYLIGVDERVLITNEPECERLEDLQHQLSPPPDDDCRAFLDALFEDVLAANMARASGALGMIGKRWAHPLLHGLARDFVGDEVADGLGIDDTPWKHASAAVRPINAVSSRVIGLVPALQRRQMRRSLAEVDQLLAETRTELGIQHDLVDQSDSAHPASR